MSTKNIFLAVFIVCFIENMHDMVKSFQMKMFYETILFAINYNHLMRLQAEMVVLNLTIELNITKQ
jgi:hypothetical protein